MGVMIKSDRLSVCVDPFGAQMTSLCLDGVERLWQGDPEIWDEHAPVLFPIVGRVHDGKYRHNGIEYTIDCPHGFARNRFFSVADQSPCRIVLRLTANEDTRCQYPFDFVFDVSYEVCGNRLEIGFRVKNQSREPMYYSFGAHPGFRIPPEDGTDFSDWYLQFAEGETLTEATLDGVFLSGNTRPLPYAQKNRVPLNHSLFAHDAFILTGLKNKTVELRSDKSAHRIVADCSQFDYLAFWQAYSTAEYLCIEPWNGLPSSVSSDEVLSEKPGIRRLSAGAEERCSVSFVLE